MRRGERGREYSGVAFNGNDSRLTVAGADREPYGAQRAGFRVGRTQLVDELVGSGSVFGAKVVGIGGAGKCGTSTEARVRAL